MINPQLCEPEIIIKRIFEMINGIRTEYGLNTLYFSNDLSFIASEFAINISTNKEPFDHSGFTRRHLQSPKAYTFTELISEIKNSSDPAQYAVTKWISNSIYCNRITSICTDIGIGIAESECGSLYITALFATFKDKYSSADNLLIAYRYVNILRKENNVNPLTVSFIATSHLRSLGKDLVFGITSCKAKSLFENCTCNKASYIIEIFEIEYNDDAISIFLKKLNEKENLKKISCKNYTEMAFYIGSYENNKIMGCLILGESIIENPIIPSLYIRYPNEYTCMILMNEYLGTHNLCSLMLSKQLCHASKSNSDKIKSRKIQLQIYSLTKKMKKILPNSSLKLGCCSFPMSTHPERELFLIWISNKKYRTQFLHIQNKQIGVGISGFNKEICYATWIVGTKNSNLDSFSENVERKNVLYEKISDGED
ncbi:hypothetical protein TRFO_07023 [Tritrichomonas foetus]|uniref:SCP domain-containing protein n=1 Tax=Tritrichomonas foetus TaxID=1144522 RepID=A0A1J4JV69_9EUKA|nr:hypothetical protein TRFO_07023 [Tritrichomonas foetus]|eukprot:OHT02610.1 hypothetical protein TRFO_07023 [Tritrichomonas foetus]